MIVLESSIINIQRIFLITVLYKVYARTNPAYDCSLSTFLHKSQTPLAQVSLDSPFLFTFRLIIASWHTRPVRSLSSPWSSPPSASFSSCWVLGPGIGWNPMRTTTRDSWAWDCGRPASGTGAITRTPHRTPMTDVAGCCPRILTPSGNGSGRVSPMGSAVCGGE